MKTLRILLLISLALPALAFGKAFGPRLADPRAFGSDLAAFYDANTPSSFTLGTVNRVAQWNDLSGSGRNLLQATGSAKPVYLAWTGTNYSYLPGVSNNGLTTVNAAANRITGDIQFDWRIAPVDWTPSGNQCFVAKWQGAGHRSYGMEMQPSGIAQFFWSADGTNALLANATAAPVVADGATLYFRITLDVDNGAGGYDVKFYTSTDGATYSQLGATVTGGSTTSIFSSDAPLEIGVRAGTNSPLSGALYDFQLRSSIGGTIVQRCNPSAVADGATSFVSETGETWTVSQSGGNMALIVGRPEVLFDGSAFFMKAAAFTLNQPTWVVLVGRPLTWTSGDYLIDGNSATTGAIIDTSTTPQINLNAGSSVAANTSFTLTPVANKIVVAVFNGSSSSLQVNSLAATTGDAGAGNMGGFTLGAKSDGTSLGNLLVDGVAVFSIAPSAAQIAQVVTWSEAYYQITP